MKVLLLALTSLLLWVALGLAETSQEKNVELLDRSRREPAKAERKRKGIKKTGGQKSGRKRKDIKGNRSRNKKPTKKTAKKINQKRKNGKGKPNRKGKSKTDRKKRKGKKNEQRKREKGNGSKKNRNKKRRKINNNKLSRNTSSSTCSDSSQVSSDCLQNVVDVMKYLKNQVRTFGRKFARIESFNKTVGNKLGKKGVFEDTAKYLLIALGGNISAAACGETGQRRAQSRAVSLAVDTYNTLNNCSAAIKEACTISDNTLSSENITNFKSCADTFNATKTSADDCRTNKKFSSDGTAACSCWSKIVAAITKVKKAGTCDASDTNDGVKASKNICMEAFSKCRKAEDSAVQLVYTCGSGEVSNSTKSTS